MTMSDAAGTTAVAPREQLSRIALLYVMAAFAASFSLVSLFLPWWIVPVAVGCIGWRLLVFSGRVSFPSTVMRFALVFLVAPAMFLQFHFDVSLDLFVVLLLLGFSLKLLELYRRKDAQLLLYLALFVLMNVFLFEQMPVYAFFVFLAVAVVFAALVAVQSDTAILQNQWWLPLRQSLLLSVQALPVMLFMFVVMPRLPPLWSMPLQTQQQGVGSFSDSLSPGDITSIAQSAELAFRATFADAVPPRRELYWYGLLLDRFDGQRWTETCHDCTEQWQRTDRIPDSAPAGRTYQVILEPHGSDWLFALAPSFIRDAAILRSDDGIFRAVIDVNQREVYDARYLPSVNDAQGLPDTSRYLALPAKGNPQSRELAQQWRREAASDEELVNKALAFYHDHFHYSLQPPPLGEQRIDSFLFGMQIGFCEHFASSFVFLMRSAGIPARVAVGYLGGDINPVDRYVIVRQYDAHAWAEVWLPERGWQRIDPTAAVAPERVERSFAEAFSGKADFAGNGGFMSYRQSAALLALQKKIDHLNYLWARWVLGYQGEQQSQLLQSLGLLSPWRMAMWGGGAVMGMFGVLSLYLYWRQWRVGSEHPATRRYRQLCDSYAQLGCERLPAETPLQYAARIVAAQMPGAADFMQLSEAYYRWCYSAGQSEPREPAAYRAAATRLSRQLLVQRWLSRVRGV